MGVGNRVGRGVEKLGSVGDAGMATGFPPMMVSQPAANAVAAISDAATRLSMTLRDMLSRLSSRRRELPQ